MQDRILGALYGHLVGDAFGVPYEFLPPAALPPEPTWKGWGTHRQPPGTYSDDGSLMLATVASLQATGRLDPEDLGQRFTAWCLHGEYAAGGQMFDIGGTTRAAIDRLLAGVPALQAGPAGERDNGNGSLMRILPISLWLAGQPPEQQVAAAHAGSQVTHGHVRSQVCCAVHGLIVDHLLAGGDRQDAWPSALEAVRQVYQAQGAQAHLSELAVVEAFDKPHGSGYVVDCLVSAWQAVRQARDYVTAVQAAVRFGHDTDTTAAVAGGLAGLVFGLEAVPAAWRAELRLDEVGRQTVQAFAQTLQTSTQKGQASTQKGQASAN